MHSLIRASSGEAALDDTEGFNQTATSQLRKHVLAHELFRCFLAVGLDASHKVRSSLAKCGHQGHQLFVEDAACALELLASFDISHGDAIASFAQEQNIASNGAFA